MEHFSTLFSYALVRSLAPLYHPDTLVNSDTYIVSENTFYENMNFRIKILRKVNQKRANTDC